MKNHSLPPAIAASKEAAGRKWLRILAAAEAAKLAANRGRYRWAEFGVRSGKSARALLELLPPGRGQIHLFDSFEGLPEEWDRGEGVGVSQAGHFACEVPEFSDSRAHVHKGWFDDTLQPFKDKNQYLIFDLMHVDCDLYSSTKTVLDVFRTATTAGTVLIFDDIAGYPNWREGQWKAWQEWIGDMPHTWIGHTRGVKRGGIANIAAAVRLDGQWD